MKKILGVRDIVFINVAAILGIRWLPIAATYGAASITLWILAALLFLLPLGLVATELATTWPDQGGLYVWTEQAFGERAGFMVSWFYWINNFFYYPTLLTFVAVTGVYLIDPALAKNKILICSIIIACLWLVTLLNYRSMKMVKWVANFGGLFGCILPGVLLVLLALAAIFIWKMPVPTDFSLANWVPNLGRESNIVFLSTLMFSMAGMEITPILAGEVRDPQKTFPRALFISALIIVALYITGTVSLNILIDPGKIGAASGIMEAVAMVSYKIHSSGVLLVMALMIILGSLGAVSIWVVTPLKMLMESVKKGVLPKFFITPNKHGMPSRAMFIQAIIISFIILGTALLPTVNAFYETLALMATITYFIPYLFMFTAFLKLRAKYPDKLRPYRMPGGKITARVFTTLGLFSVLLAIILPFVTSPKDISTAHDLLLYRIDMAIGPVVFLIMGWLIYSAYQRRTKNV